MIAANSHPPVRLGFAGVGWIGLNRMQAVARQPFVAVAALFDPSEESLAKARGAAPDATVVGCFEELLEQPLDGVVIATPSALHASQAAAALTRGLAVFCQKPLARTYQETLDVIEAARRADRLLMTDLSYRHIDGVAAMQSLVRGGELGTPFALDLTFHNAYGPDKTWFFDYEQSGGGCLIDLGTHLVDLAFFLLGDRRVERVDARLYRQGARLPEAAREVEDYAAVTLDLEGGLTVRLACSWNLPAGQEAVIEATCYGTAGAVSLHNAAGSFTNFDVYRHHGTGRELLAAPTRDWNWGGGAVTQFAHRVSAGGRYDSDCETLLDIAAVLDRSYGR